MDPRFSVLERFPNPLVFGFDEAYSLVFDDQRHGSKVIESQFKKNKKWGSRDRKVFAQVFYDIVKWQIKIMDCLKKMNLPQDSHSVLRMWLSLNLIGPWPKSLEPNLGEEAFKIWNTKSEDLGTEYSFPENLIQLLKKNLPSEKLEEFLVQSQGQAPVFLRLNTLRTHAKKLQSELQEEGVGSVVRSQETLELMERKNVFLTTSFKKGYFEIQDLNSQRVALVLNPKAGERVIDACAGAGGKSLHLATLMENKGQLIALDIGERKLEELKKRSKRQGLSNIEIRVIESSKTIKRLAGSADALLLDVPCSGLGVLRRKPDIKYKWNLESYNEALQVQEDILQDYSKMLKPGGRMLYATCSVLKEENQDQVQKFISNNPSFSLVSDQLYFPELGRGDGFYVALLKHNDAGKTEVDE